jgi:programmed cell death protein 5
MDGTGFGEAERMRQIEEMKRQALVRVLTKEAFERLGRVRVANPSLAAEAEMYLLQVYQSGKLLDKVTDEQMKGVLNALSKDRPGFRIKRK